MRNAENAMSMITMSHPDGKSLFGRSLNKMRINHTKKQNIQLVNISPNNAWDKRAKRQLAHKLTSNGKRYEVRKSRKKLIEKQ